MSRKIWREIDLLNMRQKANTAGMRDNIKTGKMSRKIWRRIDLLNIFSQEIVLIKISKEGVGVKRT